MRFGKKISITMLLLMLVACSPAASDLITEEIQEPANIRLPMGYIPNVQYAPFYAAVDQGYYQDVGIEVTFDYSYETDGVALVGANEVQFAIASGEQVLLARAQGIPVVYVLAWWQEYPVGVVSMSDQGITAPADLAGKRIGLPGLFGANYIGLRALLGAGGLVEEDVTLDSIGFNQVEALVAGRVDAAVVYINNEPIQLDAQGYDIDVIRVADYLHLVSNGIITNEETIRDHPDLVRRMVEATLRGIAATIGNPEGAYSVSKDFVEGLDESNESVQMEILLTSLELWRADPLGETDPLAWENMQQVLLDMEMLTAPQDLSQVYTNQFVEQALKNLSR